MAEAKQLQVGDVIYQTSYRDIVGKYKIDRVTEKRAFSGHHQFNRMPEIDGRLKEIGGYASRDFYIESPERTEKWQRKEFVSKFENINVHGLSTDKLRRIIAIIEEKPGAAPSDLATGIPTLDRQHQ